MAIYGAGAALLVGAAVLAACDTDDGRAMKPPTSYQEWVLQGTAPSTAPTTVALVPEITAAPVTIAPIASPSSTAGPTLPGAPIGSPPSMPEATPAEATLPDLAAQGVVFAAPFASGAELNPAYTCDGVGLTPLLTWTAPPAGTSELAVVVADHDAPTGDDTGFVHWLVVGLPANPGTVGGGNPAQLGVEATNSAGTPGWTPPCPPPGERHTYEFTLYALDQAMELPADTPPADFLVAIEAAAIGSTTITADYERTDAADSGASVVSVS